MKSFQVIKTLVKTPPIDPPQHLINYPYITGELIKIKHLLGWQSTLFRRQNHPTLDHALDSLIHHVKHKA
jgi:hypothetical protein